MPVATFAHRVYSVSVDGPKLLEEGDLIAVLGGFTLDLVSAPIAPGDYHLRLSATLGGGELFLPRSVRLVLDPHAFWGGRRFETGPQHWPWMRQRLRGTVSLPDAIPAYALAAFDARPVTIRCAANALMGGFSIYQL